MTSPKDQRLGTASGAARRLLALLVGLLAALTLVLSGAGPATAQNAVGPQPAAMILTIGPTSTASHADIGVRGPPQLRLVSATGVAAQTGTSDVLGGLAGKAQSTVGEGSGPVYGTKVHSAFASEINALGRSDLSTEVSYLNGEVVPYATRGSERLDVVEGNPLSPTAVYDLKTGSAALTPGRIAQIQANLPSGFQNVPVLEIRP